MSADRPRSSVALYAYIVALAASASWVTFAIREAVPPGAANWPAFAVLVALLVASEYLIVQFRYGGEVNGLNLVEAVLAPLLFAFPPVAAVAAIGGAQVICNVARRNAPARSAFNVSQWMLATGVGATVFHGLGAPGASVRMAGGLLIALASLGVVNQTAFTLVLAIANRRSPLGTLRGLAPVVVPGWLIGWLVNSLLGLLFVFAYAAHPVAVVLFPVPLAVLHFAYRGYAGARSDRVRLAGLHRAAGMLAEPFDPAEAIEPFLRAVAESFEARGAELVLHGAGRRVVHRAVTGEPYAVRDEEDGVPSLEGALLAQPGPVRITLRSRDALAAALGRAGWRDSLSAPLVDAGHIAGVLVVLDQSGLEGFEAGELAVIEAVARETAGTMAKGSLLGAMLEERRKLSEIVSATSDGIFTLAPDGTVRSWNPAMERITQLRAADVVDRTDGLCPLQPTTLEGIPVDFTRWTQTPPPDEIRISTAGGRSRRLSCTYSSTTVDDGSASTLVVFARDVTRDDEIAELREQYVRLASEQEAQREAVRRLHETFVPSPITLPSSEVGVRHVTSEASGGDLYDWQVLPSGDVHVAVVDVLGHGIAATRDALAVVHALRLLALQDCPLRDMVARADALLGTQNPELVATVLLGRYNPASGSVLLASGGHPPALHLSHSQGVRQVPATGGAIGWPGAGSDLTANVLLEPGDALVMYTDGLVEARKNILEGTQALIRHASVLIELPAPELAAQLVERALEGTGPHDDSLALVLRRVPAVEPRSWRLGPEPSSVRGVRRSLGEWLEARGIPRPAVDDARLVASELLTNACRVAASSVELRAVLEPGSITLEVEDDGPGRHDLDALGHEPPDPLADSERGLHVVRRVADDVCVTSSPEGSVVRARLHLLDVVPSLDEAILDRRRDDASVET